MTPKRSVPGAPTAERIDGWKVKRSRSPFARQTVWDWRDDAVQLYLTRGFVGAESWEDRPRLVCMERR